MFFRLRKPTAIAVLQRGINHYERLRVSQDASQVEIRNAFVRLALECHPDTVRRSGKNSQSAQSEFILLRSAYDCLADPKSREIYTQGLSRRGHDSVTRAAAQNFYDYANNREEEEDGGNVRFRRRNRRRGVGVGLADLVLQTQTSVEQFEKELHEALDKAFHGPQFVPNSKTDVPDAFELEERNQELLAPRAAGCTQSIVVQQLVVGRQLLGEVSWLPNVAADSGNPSTSAHTTQLLLTMGGCDVARARRDETAAMVSFEKKDGNDECWREFCRLDESSGVLLRGRAGGSDDAGTVTHRVIRTRSPGVDRLLLYHRRGFVEYMGTRAWLPPHQLWWFQPRDLEFSCGGWYWETNRNAQHSRRKKGIAWGSLFDRLFRRDETAAAAAAGTQDKVQSSMQTVTSSGAGTSSEVDLPSAPLDPSVAILLSGFDALSRKLRA